MSTTAESTLRTLRNASNYGEMIADVLEQQNAKLNALLRYLLSGHSEESERHGTLEFGGGGVLFVHPQPLAVGDYVNLKLFLPEEAAALFSFAQVIESTPTDDGHQIRLLFTHLLEDDRELLVRASLHAQSRLLKKRAAEREQPTDD